ncbi:hypothetical protein [Gordonia liuliyuniae]|uniref:Signal transduction histidine kinase n=1 Tax=Gordonia liuliyuniae TaxID=2911517 RepID=A0ABS9IN76_9ACTN|nr:hypothetical protein [Gordonia liuliyuniae]MCF8586986.1 hypothetical protein [Gordonia liuliyuniae]
MGATVTGPDIQVPDIWWRGRPRDDASAIVGLQTPQVMIGAVIVWAGFVVLGLSGGGLQWPALYAVSFIGTGAAWAIALRARGTPMARSSAAAVVVLETAAVVGVIAAVEPLVRGPLMPCAGATAIVGALLCLRGRVDVAWISFVVSTAAIGVAGMVRADSGEYLVIMTPGNLGVLVLMTVFATVIGPRAEQIFALRRQARRESAAFAVRAVRDQQLARLDERVRPLLQSIAAGEVLDDEQLAHCRLVEAQLRDRIRAPGLDVPALADAAWAARKRGVRVLLLDDHTDPTVADEPALAVVGDDRARLVERVWTAGTAALDQAEPGADVTVRLLPAGRAVAATISVAADGTVSLQEFA